MYHFGESDLLICPIRERSLTNLLIGVFDSRKKPTHIFHDAFFLAFKKSFIGNVACFFAFGSEAKLENKTCSSFILLSPVSCLSIIFSVPKTTKKRLVSQSWMDGRTYRQTTRGIMTTTMTRSTPHHACIVQSRAT